MDECSFGKETYSYRVLKMTVCVSGKKRELKHKMEAVFCPSAGWHFHRSDLSHRSYRATPENGIFIAAAPGVAVVSGQQTREGKTMSQIRAYAATQAKGAL